ncbi:hypothetical protein FRC08_003667 [Ceratobasidium sp. 394]|nr:hypothetical protein FRC08_003667 [Ceratobasidium sp. 394]
MVANVERAGARELARVMGPAGEQLAACQGLLAKVAEMINQLDWAVAEYIQGQTKK